MTHGAHDHPIDPRNEQVLVDLNGKLTPKAQATVSILDSGFVLGDGIWEGMRLHEDRVPFLDRHLRRLFDGARAIDLDLGVTREELTQRIARVLKANGMHDHVHMRLMVSRGVKLTPYQDPRATISGPTIVILPEYKAPSEAVYTKGLKLFTVHVRRGRPDVQDPRLNTHSKHNCIQACIQAAKAGADEGLMLDPQGFVATCNSTHFFIVHRGQVWTSSGDYCLDGITRGLVIEIAKEAGLEVQQRNFSLSDVYAADEAFVTGTFAGLASVGDIDGRAFNGPFPGPMVKRLCGLYQDRILQEPELPGLK
ncbi:MAG: branched-chain amino acid aminotransferase [Candidatus Paceibacteria bacterium]|jgi:branched-chain amino acid aminotransferase